MTIDTRTAAEITYDSLKDGSAYVKPQEDLWAWIDRCLEEGEAPPADGLTAVLEDIERIFERAPQVRVTHNYLDLEQEGDLCDEPRGPLAYANFLAGSKDDGSLCEIAFPASGKDRPVVYMFGRDEIDLDRVERTLNSLLALLADPRVKAAREARQ